MQHDIRPYLIGAEEIDEGTWCLINISPVLNDQTINRKKKEIKW